LLHARCREFWPVKKRPSDSNEADAQQKQHRQHAGCAYDQPGALTLRLLRGPKRGAAAEAASAAKGLS